MISRLLRLFHLIVYRNDQASATDINLIENTARSCEELHAANMVKLLPQGCFDPMHSNDPFMFLFKRERINVGPESATCRRLVQEKYDRIVKACLDVINVLNLHNLNPTGSGSASMASSVMTSSLNIGASFTSTFTSSGSGTTSSGFSQFVSLLIYPLWDASHIMWINNDPRIHHHPHTGVFKRRFCPYCRAWHDSISPNLILSISRTP